MVEFIEKKLFLKKEEPFPDDKREIFKEGKWEEVEENKELIKKREEEIKRIKEAKGK